MKELISIIIPCYNDAKFVEQAVNSAINQTYSNIEVIVVDDGSNAETKAILNKLEPKIAKLLTQENKGQSTARNIGILEAKGKYILTLDSDDYFEATFCEKAILFLSNEDVKIVSCFATLIYDNGTTEIYKPLGGSLSSFLYGNRVLGSVMFKKEDWIKCSGFDETMNKGFEDWEFYIRLLKEGGKAKVIKEYLFNYRKRNYSTTSIANRNKYELLNYIFCKHQDLYKNHFEGFVNHLLSRIEREEQEKIKNTIRLDFKIGKMILKPFRIIKSFFKNKLRF